MTDSKQSDTNIESSLQGLSIRPKPNMKSDTQPAPTKQSKNTEKPEHATPSTSPPSLAENPTAFLNFHAGLEQDPKKSSGEVLRDMARAVVTFLENEKKKDTDKDGDTNTSIFPSINKSLEKNVKNVAEPSDDGTTDVPSSSTDNDTPTVPDNNTAEASLDIDQCDCDECSDSDYCSCDECWNIDYCSCDECMSAEDWVPRRPRPRPGPNPLPAPPPYPPN